MNIKKALEQGKTREEILADFTSALDSEVAALDAVSRNQKAIDAATKEATDAMLRLVALVTGCESTSEDVKFMTHTINELVEDLTEAEAVAVKVARKTAPKKPASASTESKRPMSQDEAMNILGGLLKECGLI